jgi:hypothetical protein
MWRRRVLRNGIEDRSQPSAVHTGQTDDPARALQHLFRALVAVPSA